MITFDEAIERLATIASPLGPEKVPIAEAHGRVCAEPIRARVSAPPTNVSAMDGYAVRDEDLEKLPARLPVAGESFPGQAHGAALVAGQCVRIFTGASVPAGADRVVIQEQVRREGRFAIFDAVTGPARHVRTAGSDFSAGDVLLDAGTWLGPRQLVAAAGADLSEVPVWRRPRLMVLSTGDELVEPGTSRARAQSIPESVSFGVAALAQTWGAQYLGRAGLADRLPELEQAAGLALRDSDLVVVTGGASVGEKDFARQMFAAHKMELVFSKVAIKPGKPVWLGTAAGRVILGLPGNPTSALVTARLFLAPLLAGMTGRSIDQALRWRRMALGTPMPATGDRETFARAFSAGEEVRLSASQDSSAQKILAGSDLLVRLRPGTPSLAPGTAVETLDF